MLPCASHHDQLRFAALEGTALTSSDKNPCTRSGHGLDLTSRRDSQGLLGTPTSTMKPNLILTTEIVFSSLCLATACSTVLAPAYMPPTVSSGWTAQLVANGFTKPRTLAFDSSGALLILDSGVGVKRLTFADNGGSCLIPDTPVLVVNATSV